MHTPSKAAPYTKVLDKSLNKIGRAVAGGNSTSIARVVYEHEDIRGHLFKRFLVDIGNECSSLCKCSLPNTNAPSLFRKVAVKDMPTFSWSKCISQLQSAAPLLLQLLITIVGHSDRRNQKKKGNVTTQDCACMAVAILLKERNKHISGIQTMLSLILFSSRIIKTGKFNHSLHP